MGVGRAPQLFFGEAVAALLAVVAAVVVHVVNHLHVVAGRACPALSHDGGDDCHVQGIHNLTLAKGIQAVNQIESGREVSDVQSSVTPGKS